MMCRRRALEVLGLALVIAGAPAGADAQRPSKMPRIGYLVLSPLVDPPSEHRKAFLEGLRELGYVDRKNILIEYRSAKWNRELLPDLAEELVDLKVDVIVAVPGAIAAAQHATKAIPIVVPAFTDPVETGLVASLARPGGNLTGTGWSDAELGGKRLQLLKEAIPRIRRVAVLWNPENQGESRRWKETQAAAGRLGLTLESHPFRDPKDFPGVMTALTRKRPDALITFVNQLTTAYRPIIVELATKNRLPTIFALRVDVEAGGLMAYGPSVSDLFRRAADYVDRILKGAKPTDLPVEQPTKFEFVVNARAAKALGLTLPPSIMIRADHVIE
jgi:putative ABC transport system substrate-binding protein